MTRSALISLAGQPRLADGSPITLAGKTIAGRQVDFALAAGCEHIVVLGDEAKPEVAVLRRQVEAGGAAFQPMRNAHGLLGVIGAADELLVIAPGLIVERGPPRPGAGVYTFPAQTGVELGFERIDADHAWAGVLVVNGAAVERLAELPRESEPAPALLRIALQARVPMKPVPEEALSEGTWSLADEADDPVAHDRAWLVRHTVAPARWAWTRRLANILAAPWTASLVAAQRSVAGLSAALAVLLAGAVILSWQGFAVAGFSLIAGATLVAACLRGINALRVAPFGVVRAVDEAVPGFAIDASIFACIVLSIEGPWLQRLFTPAALLAALYATHPERQPSIVALAGDRGIIALGLAVAGAFGVVEPVAMAFVLAILAIAGIQRARDGLTPD